MTTTARQATTRIADTAALAELVITGLSAEFESCGICGHAAAELYQRIDNRDGTEVECCEHCADTADVSWCE
jgi:hypothetical protein